MVTICTEPEKLNKVKKIVNMFDCVFFSAGLHPLSVGKAKPFTTDLLLQTSAHPKMVGIGETGLDYHYSAKTSEKQINSFRSHIAVSRETGLPLIIHSRSADDDMLRILKEEYRRGEFSGVLHCFSSGLELAKFAIDIGLYISISGIATFAKSNELRNIIKTIPKSQLLIETDSPYLAPHPYRGKRNEPSFVAEIAKYLADFLEVELEIFREQTTLNFHYLFKKVSR